MKLLFFLPLFCLILACCDRDPQETQAWHGIQREIRYMPDGGDFLIVNGTRRFNRALYGTNTAFRVEAGDLPEFALYMPGMGGCLRLGLVSGKGNKWLIHADRIEARYRAGSMLYEIRDTLLGNGRLSLCIMAMDRAEGLVLRVTASGVTPGTGLAWAFGGATGKRFNRDGDIGADPESSFDLRPEYCADNSYEISENSFLLFYGSGKQLSEEDLYEIRHRPAAGTGGTSLMNVRSTGGIVPPGSGLKMVDAVYQGSPRDLLASAPQGAPAVAGMTGLASGGDYFFCILDTKGGASPAYDDLPGLFGSAEGSRKELAGRVQLVTPDPFINNLGGALAIAADAIWEPPSYLHGAVAWRSRLNGWRGAYVADPLGWHDRARMHFRSYARSQVTSPETGPVTPDTALNHARQEERLGTALFSSGYISRYPDGNIRCHHYDMNLVYIDALLNHLNWTGDLDFAGEIWPVLVRHLAWEKRCFDADNDGLYDAYCCIWASDALQYSGGGVTHSSAYNYRANLFAAELAVKLGEDPQPYREEAEKIGQAVGSKLWIPAMGRFAEYIYHPGPGRVHPAAGLWTVYHALDAGLADRFRAFQALRYIDTEIPHIPVRADGLPGEGYYVLSTTNWLPYTWSVNNVALAELLHTSLAYWQGGRPGEAFRIWKSALLESMYLGASPGNIGQLLFYDAIRGELYRDFADPVGMTARSLVEGLFGILPDAMNGNLNITPGFPDEWDHASLKIPDVNISYERKGRTEKYILSQHFPVLLRMKMQLKSRGVGMPEITANGEKVRWTWLEESVGAPRIVIDLPPMPACEVVVRWRGRKPGRATPEMTAVSGEEFIFRPGRPRIVEVYDPRQVLATVRNDNKSLQAEMAREKGRYTVFLKLQQEEATWWKPLLLDVKNRVEQISCGPRDGGSLAFRLKNFGRSAFSGSISLNSDENVIIQKIRIRPGKLSRPVTINKTGLVPGTNRIVVRSGKERVMEGSVTCRDPECQGGVYETIDLTPYCNDHVTNIFRNQYLSPRTQYPTLQIPLQGIGNWCYPLVNPEIDDAGLRLAAGDSNRIVVPPGIPFHTPGDPGKKNIIFTSLWDNYPASAVVPVSGKALHAYLLMAGTTNPMQSRFVNGKIIVEYTDGSRDSLLLTNPETWWPIEQDYYLDGWAFRIDGPVPPRLHLKTGSVPSGFSDYVSIRGFTDFAIDGGAATVLDLPLDPTKELKQLSLTTTANEVVTGLMSLTLLRN